MKKLCALVAFKNLLGLLRKSTRGPRRSPTPFKAQEPSTSDDSTMAVFEPLEMVQEFPIDRGGTCFWFEA